MTSTSAAHSSFPKAIPFPRIDRPHHRSCGGLAGVRKASDLPSRLAPTASQLYGNILAELLSEMGGAAQFDPGIDDEVCSTGVLASWRFATRGNMGPVSVHWYDGGLLPERPDELEQQRGRLPAELIAARP